MSRVCLCMAWYVGKRACSQHPFGISWKILVLESVPEGGKGRFWCFFILPGTAKALGLCTTRTRVSGDTAILRSDSCHAERPRRLRVRTAGLCRVRPAPGAARFRATSTAPPGGARRAFPCSSLRARAGDCAAHRARAGDCEPVSARESEIPRTCAARARARRGVPRENAGAEEARASLWRPRH